MTRLLEILISLAIVVALYLVVGLALPSSRHLVEKIETNRKLTIVFDTLNSFRRFKDWNPLVLRDPRVQMTLSGPDSGVGARLDYVSKEEGLGKGSWEITESVSREKVSFKIDNEERGTNKRTSFSFKPTGRNNRNVEITQTYDVDYGWNLLGRYSGMYVARYVGDDMKMGLSRLVGMLASVPNEDYAIPGSKLTIAFDSLNSLRRFDDWNPLVLRDPRMQLSYSGPESGVGARMDYVSKEDSLGKGSWEISESVPRKKITYKLDNVQRGAGFRGDDPDAAGGGGERLLMFLIEQPFRG